MKTVLQLAALFAVLVTTAQAQDNLRLVPNGWVEEPTPNEPGRRFISPSGEAILETSGTRANPRSLKRDMDAVAYRDGERITYHRRGGSWLAVSGFRGDRIFYRKSNLACSGTVWHHVELEYPASHKKRMDATVTRIAREMTAYNNRC